MKLSPNQLKGKIKSLAVKDNVDARVLMRIYMMERFLERLSFSKYQNNFIIKGGILVSSMVGISCRTTMDIDTTVKCIDLNENNILKIVNEICQISLDDEIKFKINKLENIMDEMEYPGIRIHIDSLCGSMITPIKIDISTGDVITPKEIIYPYKLLIEDKKINLLSYNLETILAEKTQTILARDEANTRMRDFYDIFILNKFYKNRIDVKTFALAFKSTCENRGTIYLLDNYRISLNRISSSDNLNLLWMKYQEKYQYAKDISYYDIMICLKELITLASKN